MPMTASFRIGVCVAMTLAVPHERTMSAATLAQRTNAAFDRYVAESDRQAAASLADKTQFLWTDGSGRGEDRAALGRGQLVITRLEAHANGQKIDIPGGLVHHWVGVVFVKGATVDQAVSLLQDYDRHAE